jgi:hypothetical protein
VYSLRFVHRLGMHGYRFAKRFLGFIAVHPFHRRPPSTTCGLCQRTACSLFGNIGCLRLTTRRGLLCCLGPFRLACRFCSA